MNRSKRSFYIIASLFSFIFLPLSVAQAAGSLTIQSLSPGTSVSAGIPATLTVSASGFTNPNFLIADNFGGTSLSSSNINASGYFSWTPTANDIGTHSFTITAGDSLGNSANVTQTITVTAPVMTLSSPSPSTAVNAGVTVSFSATVAGLSNPSYSVTDSISGTISNSNINSSGYFSWTPSSVSDVGSHTITVTATDALGHSTTASQTITVNSLPSISVTSLTPTGSIPPGQVITFTITSSGLTSPTFSLYDSFTPSNISKSNINASGYFSWTPTTDDIGTHTLLITASDGTSGYSPSLKQVIIVQPLTVNIQGFTQKSRLPGNPAYFNIMTGGFATTSYSVSDSFTGSTVSNTNINSLGNFYWTPSSADIGTHMLTVTASDPLGHTGSTTQQIIVSSTTPSMSTPTLSTTTGVIQTGVSPLVVTQPESSHMFTTYLASGSHGAEVTLLQTALAKEGFFVATPNGLYGPVTTAAVKKFQIAHGLEPVGFVGAGTRAALNQVAGTATTVASTPSPSGADALLLQAAALQAQLALLKGGQSTIYKFVTPLDIGSSGAAVTELQKRLAAEGLYGGPINGKFGPLTRAAVMKYQAKHGLTQLGNVGPGTRAALNKE